MRSVRQTPLGQFVTQTTCTKCGGEGHVIAQPCERCGGPRTRAKSRRGSTVNVPAGVDDGSRIRIAGNGEAGTRGGPAGDLYVYLSVAPHRTFKRDGRDTFVDVPISFPQAALGATIEVPSLERRRRTDAAAGNAIGHDVRLRGLGMPSGARLAARRSSRHRARRRSDAS